MLEPRAVPGRHGDGGVQIEAVEVRMQCTGGGSGGIDGRTADPPDWPTGPALEYAPSISATGLELFFTRLDSGQPLIYRAVRRSSAARFESPQPISAIEGFAEAPSLSGDGRSLYYHKRQGDGFAIYRVSR